MNWREFINDEIDETINALNKAKTAIAEDDAMGAGIWMGKAQSRMINLNNKAYGVVPEILDKNVSNDVHE